MTSSKRSARARAALLTLAYLAGCTMVVIGQRAWDRMDEIASMAADAEQQASYADQRASEALERVENLEYR